MSLKSMTGFAALDGALGDANWHWELRSVNGRGLEIRMRLPSGFDALESKIRALCQERLARGNCSVTLTLRRTAGQTEIRLNEPVLRQALAAAERARVLTNMEPARVDTLLTIRGVIETVDAETDPEAEAALQQALIASFAEALAGMLEARDAEGKRLQQVITEQLTQIADLAERAAGAATRQPEAIEKRLGEQVARLIEAAPTLDLQRLHQEAALLAAKADIQEELDRLRAHVEAARDLLAQDQPVGRKFDFLTQEFNREANTLCSKAADIEISRAGLALKSVIDQLREQVQNIE